MDFSKIAEEVVPFAGTIINSFRSIGYSLDTAIADIIDNSITAQSKNIWIETSYEGENTKIFIKDDGKGMTEKELIEALRLGSKNPNEKRDSKDLGRFGLGLKTASFSQCRKLTVVSKQNTEIFCRKWDLDFVEQSNQWILLKDCPNDYIEKINDIESGTLIIWENLDRLTKGLEKDNATHERKYTEEIAKLRTELSLVFHRFLEKGHLNIFIGGVEVTPWNPFLPGHPSRLEIQETYTHNSKIRIHPWILPHRSFLQGSNEYIKAGFNKGWTNMQGFYVYRGDRLLVASGWLGLSFNGLVLKKDHEYDLARIEVDLPNDLDFEWNIDIKKSTAKPPAYLREELAKIAVDCRRKASEVYRGRTKGIKISHISQDKTIKSPVWKGQVLRNGKTFFQLNHDNPLIKDLIEASDKATRTKVKTLLRLIEEYLPIEDFICEERREETAPIGNPFEGCTEEQKRLKEELIRLYMEEYALTEEDAIKKVNQLNI